MRRRLTYTHDSFSLKWVKISFTNGLLPYTSNQLKVQPSKFTWYTSLQNRLIWCEENLLRIWCSFSSEVSASAWNKVARCRRFIPIESVSNWIFQNIRPICFDDKVKMCLSETNTRWDNPSITFARDRVN